MLRWGILGTSFISDVVAKAIIASPKSQISAVFGRDEGRLAAFAERYGITAKYTSIDALLEDATVDAVYVGLPSHKHAEATIAAAKRGKAILSEKALATTMRDSHAMRDAVKESGVFFVEGLMYLSHPVHDKLVEIIKSGKLGKIRGVSGYYAANIAAKANPLGKGTIYNLGCYPVSLLHLVMDAAYGPEAWDARTVLGHGNMSHDDGVAHVRDAALTVRFDQTNTLATLQSTDSFGNGFDFQIMGDKAALRFETNPWLPQGGDKNVMVIRPYKGEVERVVVNSEDGDAFACQVRRVEDCVAKGVKEAPRPSPSWDDSIRIMGLLTQWESDIMTKFGHS